MLKGCIYNPPEKIQDVGLWGVKKDLGLDFRREGLKGNDQKKYTMEVKARKSDGLV